MTNYQIHTRDTAPVEAEKALEQAQAMFGFVPNLLGVMATAPRLAQSYLYLGSAVSQSSFTPVERHVVWFTINAFHGCTYCMAAHTGGAKKEKIPDEVIAAARANTPYGDPRLEALRKFTLSMLERRGWVPSNDLEAFHKAGFTKQQVLEVILAIAHKTLSNYTNHIAGTPLDEQFEAYAWNNPDEAAAE